MFHPNLHQLPLLYTACPMSAALIKTLCLKKLCVIYIYNQKKINILQIFLYDSSMVSPYPLLFFGGSIDVRKVSVPFPEQLYHL